MIINSKPDRIKNYKTYLEILAKAIISSIFMGLLLFMISCSKSPDEKKRPFRYFSAQPEFRTSSFR